VENARGGLNMRFFRRFENVEPPAVQGDKKGDRVLTCRR